MTTVVDLLKSGADLDSDSPRLDVELLLAHALGQTRTWLYTWPDNEVADELECVFRELLTRRRAGEPLAYILGERDFWSLTLAVNDDTLIPRPETETLVSWALELPLPTDAAVADLGTGSGAIALALASERDEWRITAADSSDDALAVAAANARRLELGNVRCVVSDWFDSLEGQRCDAVLSNPPYVAEGDPHLAKGDVRFEPRAALVAGEQGLDDLQRIVSTSHAHLKPGGWLLLEHGFEQRGEVQGLLRDAGFASVTTRDDLAGLPRVSGGQLNAG